MLRPVTVIMSIIIALSGQAGDISGTADAQLEASGAYELEEALPEETKELLDDTGIALTPDGVGGLSPSKLIDVLGDVGGEQAEGPLKACLSALCIIILCALARSMAGREESSLSGTFDTVGSAAAAAAVCVPAAALIDSAAGAVTSLCRFCSVLVPVLSGLAAATGHTSTAASYSVVTLTVVEAINVVIPAAVIPLLRVMLAVGAVSALSPQLGLDKLISSAEKNAKWLMGLLGVVLSGTLGVSTVAASAADGAATRAAKFLISGTVPVVGGAISDAMGTIRNCVAIVRTSAGAFGLIAGLFVVLPPAISAVIWRVGLNCTAWAAEALGAARPAAAMRSLSSVISITLGVVALVLVVTTCSAAVIMNLRSA